MAKVKSTGYTDTPVDGVASLTFPRAVLNVGSDFRVKSNNAGKEVVITNITCPVDRPEKVRIAYSDIANIYSGTGIEASLAAPTKRGVSVLVQVTEVITVTDDTDPDYRIDLPVSYHLVVKVPASEYITAADVQTGLGRLLSSLFDTGVTTTSRLEAILRGSLVPTEL
ncbi:TPA_asm: coat protein [ssRNA phage SRR7976310_3]|uniref:Coat protein n=1 Tax=ssRNA phage SRR7976310_3 TaxID=2786681 RepID=A0A8S5L5J8_9VIRU|nr:coat protein [ssRNA phage SRR7976310_3]DAD52701.1 TPA_asm: coat protein [ssRNA phage SRR7976310_3]